jgi:hypothetical protein
VRGLVVRESAGYAGSTQNSNFASPPISPVCGRWRASLRCRYGGWLVASPQLCSSTGPLVEWRFACLRDRNLAGLCSDCVPRRSGPIYAFTCGCACCDSLHCISSTIRSPVGDPRDHSGILALGSVSGTGSLGRMALAVQPMVLSARGGAGPDVAFVSQGAVEPGVAADGACAPPLNAIPFDGCT